MTRQGDAGGKSMLAPARVGVPSARGLTLTRWLLVTLVAVMAPLSFAQSALTPGKLATHVTFDEPAPSAANSELLHRLLTPRQRQRELAAMAAKHETLATYPFQISAERYSVYLPKQQPPSGYGLLVFIPPWEDARLPPGWAYVLDREGMIFVSAEKSGNNENVPGRRTPLALMAVHGAASRFPIDPSRTFVGGFSGGSRAALRTALAYPDVFAGVVLNAGSDPIGNAHDPLPSPALMTLLQTRTRFVFVTGETDDINLSKDVEARKSLGSWCIVALRSITRTHIGHEAMDGGALSDALQALQRVEKPQDQTHCMANLDARLKEARAEAATLGASPDDARAQAKLERLDEEFGGLLDDTAEAPLRSDEHEENR